MAKEFKVIGKKVERVDAFERLTGEAKYASDIYLPGMLYVKILRSPHPHAKVVKIDTSKAQALPGVKAILTPADVPDFAIHKRATPPSFQSPFLRRRPVMQATKSLPWQPWTRRRRRMPWN